MGLRYLTGDRQAKPCAPRVFFGSEERLGCPANQLLAHPASVILNTDFNFFSITLLFYFCGQIH